jgi:hypothetical protein
MNDNEFIMLDKLVGDLFYLLNINIYKKYNEYKTISDKELIKVLLRKDLCDDDCGSIIKFIINTMNCQVVHYKYSNEDNYNLVINKTCDSYELKLYNSSEIIVLVNCSETKIYLINMF